MCFTITETLLAKSPQPVADACISPQVMVQKFATTLELCFYLFVVLRLVSLAVALLSSTVGVVILWETRHDVLRSR